MICLARFVRRNVLKFTILRTAQAKYKKELQEINVSIQLYIQLSIVGLFVRVRCSLGRYLLYSIIRNSLLPLLPLTYSNVF